MDYRLQLKVETTVIKNIDIINKQKLNLILCSSGYLNKIILIIIIFITDIKSKLQYTIIRYLLITSYF